MNKQAVAKELLGLAKSLVAASDAASVITGYRQPMINLEKLVRELVQGFEDAQSQLVGLRKFGVGDTEAETLLREMVVPRVRSLKTEIDMIAGIVSRAM